jgi:DNA-directed RNA polymerase specialized sigma24 family protein
MLECVREPSDLPIASLRRLARSLICDEARAEDVVQEAWLAALRRGPPPEGLRAWLAEAMRRIAGSRGRSELRRAEREQRAARPEAQPSAAEASARIEVLRYLLDAVDGLE